MSLLLETYDLHRRFGRTDALNGVNLTLEEGSVFGLVGPNGAGKTTLVKAVMNIIEPTRGRASVLGTDSRRLGPAEFQQIGHVSENQDLPDWMTVGYLMDYLKPFYPRWDDGRARELLTQFELPLNRKLKDLSRGMRMKAALASSLAYHPKLLVLDEPFSGLDPLVREEFVQGLVEVAEETTMLISSHDLAEIESFATHVGFLDQGRLKFSESLANLSDRFREVEVTIGTSPSLPREWPAHWLRVETSAAVVRFVDSQFDIERSQRDVRQLLGDNARVETTAMSLRAIFIALAKQTRKAA
jgi:ABC-2 type transport system ATP-binding protein